MSAPSPLPSDSAELQRLRQELAALRRELDDVAHAIGHDLRAPLRHITAFAGLLREDLGETLSGDAAMYLRTVDDSAKQLGRMVDGLMAWSRLGRVALAPERVATRAVVDEVCTGLAPQYQGRALQWRIADHLPDVQADPLLLRQLWQLLLDNAVKFTTRSEAAVIAVGAQPLADGGCQWHVQDNGAGFNPRQAGRLFQPFARLHSANEFDGLGLGLAMASRIVQRHGGTLTVHSDGAGSGCRVSWTLPTT
jgi:light-regulated signal transduction histidine kinase (bacteriophytochrome)